MAIVYINVEYAKTRNEEKVSSSENDTTTKNTTKVSDEEMIINMIQDNPQITVEEMAEKHLISVNGVRYHIKKLKKD